MSAIVIKIITIIFLFFSNKIYSADIGSDTAVNRFNTQQTVNDGDRIAGFAALQGGFAFYGAEVRGTFDSFFPVSGIVDLKFGELTLGRNLIFKNVADITSLGTLIGGGCTFELSSSMDSFPNQSLRTYGVSLAFLTGATQASAVESCAWSYNNDFVAIGQNANDFRIYEFDGTQLTLRNSINVGGMTINATAWHPSAYNFAIGRDIATGPEFYLVSYNPVTYAFTVLDSQEVGVSIYALAWHPTGNWIAVGNSSNQEVAIYSTVSNSFVSSYNADAVVDYRALSWDDSGDYLAVGLVAAAANELLVLSFNQSTAALSLADSENIGYAVSAVSWCKTSTNFLAVGVSNTSGELLKIYEFDQATSTLTQRASKSDLNANVLSVDWSSQDDYLVLGRASGSGTEFRFYNFDPDNYDLGLITSFELGTSVNALRWSPNGTYVATVADDSELSIYKLIGDFVITFSNVHLVLNTDVTLKENIIFQGQSSIDGNGNCLTMATTNTVLVDSDSSLLLRDIRIEGMAWSNIACIDNTSTVSVDMTSWFLDANYSFTEGRIDILSDFEIIGDGYIFTYGTDQTSTIYENGSLILDTNLTFSYDPSSSSRDLISLDADTSQLILRGATLFSTDVGLRLTKGKLIVEQKSFVWADGTIESEAISFGDSISATNDLSIEYLSCLEIVNGLVLINNVNC